MIMIQRIEKRRKIIWRIKKIIPLILKKNSVEDVDIINNVSDYYDKLINMFDDLDIKDDKNNSSWFKLPINERIKIRENKEMNNKTIMKKDNKKKYKYPKE